MLSTLFGKKSDHPLADIKSVQTLLGDLPKNDANRSLTELTELLESLFENPEFKAEHQFTVMRMLDEAAQPFIKKLSREYFTPFEINKFLENRLWTGLSNWYNLAARSYLKLYTDYCNGEKGSAGLKPQLPLLNARTVCNIRSQLKFICSRYGQVDNLVWVNLGHLYRHAEANNYLDAPVSLYPGVPGNTTVKSEVAVLLVWYDTGLAALSPLYIHLNERLLCQYRSMLNVHAEVSQISRISFDLSRSAEPSRINAGATTHPSMRFIGMPGLQGKLEDLMKTLKKNIVPEDVNLGGTYDAEVATKAVQYLLSYVVAPPVRRNARRAVSVTLNIVSGFDGVIAMTGTGQGSAAPAQWQTEDISASGFSAMVPVKGNESTGIGSLLGIQPQGVKHWGVAVVRRLLRDESSQLRIGSEILSNQVAGVMLNYNTVPGGPVENGRPAIWLFAKQDNAAGTVQLLLKADTFFQGRSLQVQVNGKNHLLMPLELVERGLDYDLAKFRFIVQEGTAEEAY